MTNPFDEEGTDQIQGARSGGDVESAPEDFAAAKRSGGDVESPRPAGPDGDGESEPDNEGTGS